jgi:hypothetical protein
MTRTVDASLDPPPRELPKLVGMQVNVTIGELRTSGSNAVTIESYEVLS